MVSYGNVERNCAHILPDCKSFHLSKCNRMLIVPFEAEYNFSNEYNNCADSVCERKICFLSQKSGIMLNIRLQPNKTYNVFL